jgi:serine protease Do
MRFFKLNKKSGIAMAGGLLIIFGSVSLLVAQREPLRQLLQVTLDGAYLGIEMADVTADSMAKYKLSAETGVIVRSVEKGSPAESARLQENDVILEYAGIPVFSAAELTRLVRETPVGRTVILGVSRDGKKLNISAKLAERKSGALSEHLVVVPPGGIARQFEFAQPGRGVLQFRIPEARTRSFSLTPPFANRVQLGVTVQALTDQLADFLGVTAKKGILVTAVTAGSPSHSVLRAGDVIVAVDGKPIAEPTDLTQAIIKKEPGSKVDLKVIRDKKEITLSVEFPKAASSQRGIKI